MRVLFALTLAGCSAGAESRDAGPRAPLMITGVETSEATTAGDTDPARYLDLPLPEPWDPATTTGAPGSESTGGETSTGAVDPTTSGSSTTGDGVTSTGEAGSSTGTSTGTDTDTGSESSAGDTSTGDSLTDCECVDGADNVCDLAAGSCSATLPGGLCDPNGDGAFFDGDWTLGWMLYQQKCG